MFVFLVKNNKKYQKSDFIDFFKDFLYNKSV